MPETLTMFQPTGRAGLGKLGARLSASWPVQRPSDLLKHPMDAVQLPRDHLLGVGRAFGCVHRHAAVQFFVESFSHIGLLQVEAGRLLASPRFVTRSPMHSTVAFDAVDRNNSEITMPAEAEPGAICRSLACPTT